MLQSFDTFKMEIIAWKIDIYSYQGRLNLICQLGTLAWSGLDVSFIEESIHYTFRKYMEAEILHNFDFNIRKTYLIGWIESFDWIVWLY